MRQRPVSLSLGASLFLLAATVGPALTTDRTASAEAGGAPFGFYTTDYMSARWNVVSYYAEGSYTWQFSNFLLGQVVANARSTPSDWTWYDFEDVYFYNAAGTQVAAFHTPPIGACGYVFYHGPSDLGFPRCKSVFYAPFSATKFRIHWGMNVTCGCGWTFNPAFQATSSYIPIP